jgi:uncharacterized membrane-anchored protein YhcB (DUF1043 family)
MDTILTLIGGIFLGMLVHFRITQGVEKQNEKLLKNIQRLEKENRTKKKINPKMFLTKDEIKNGKSKSI